MLIKKISFQAQLCLKQSHFLMKMKKRLFLEGGNIKNSTVCHVLYLQSDIIYDINQHQAKDLDQTYQNPTLEKIPLNNQNSETNNTHRSLYNLINIGLIN